MPIAKDFRGHNSFLDPQRLVAYSIACLVVVVASCCDVVRQQPADLAKYPELKALFDACGEFKRGSLDLDVGVFTAFFDFPQSSGAEFFSVLDQHAAADGWQVLAEAPTKHVYRKNLRRLPQQQKEDTVWVILDSKEEEVKLVWK